jgi:hypothetical protein
MKTFIVSTAILVMTVLSAGTAAAQNPHFVVGPTITDNGTTLTARGSIAGLGNNQQVDIVLQATATITTTCRNPQGKIAPGQTKTANVTAASTFTSDKNGRVTFTLTTPTPEAGPCPNGKWTGTVTDVTFSNPTLTVNGQQIPL